MKTNKMTQLALAVLTSTFSLLAFANPPDGQVTIRNIVHAGPGCPSGSVAGDVSPDAKAFTLAFDQYVVEAGPGIPLASGRKFCQLTINLRVPNGWSYTLFDVDYRGYANLESGTTGEEKSTYYFQGNNGQSTFTSTFKGPYNQDYSVHDTLGLNAEVWSPCGADRALNIKSSIAVRAPAGRQAMMTMDSIDGELRHVYGLRWRRCN